MKVFLNKLRSKWLLWAIIEKPDARVILPCLAAQQLKAEQIAADPEILLKDDFMDESARSIIMQAMNKSGRTRFFDWRQEIAAAHFLVTPEEALQPIMFRRFAQAFQSGDFRQLKLLASLNYFATLLRDYADNQHTEWRSNPSQLIHFIEFLNSVTMRDEDIESLTMNLLDIATGVENWNPFEQRWIPAIKTLVRHDLVRGRLISDRVWESVSVVNMNQPLADWLKILDEAATLFDGLGKPRAIEFSDANVFVNVTLEATRLGIQGVVPDALLARPNIGVSRAFADAIPNLDAKEFTRLRGAIVKGSSCSYKEINRAVLGLHTLPWQKKLDYLLQNPGDPAAELELADLKSSFEFEENAKTTETQAALLVVARKQPDRLDYEYLRSGQAAAEFIGQIAETLLKWNRSDVISGKEWWTTDRQALIPRVLDWIASNGRTSEFSPQELAQLRRRLQDMPDLFAAYFGRS